MELILPGLFIFFVVMPLLFLWLAFRVAGTAQRLARRQRSAVYPVVEMLERTFEPDEEGVWPPPPDGGSLA